MELTPANTWMTLVDVMRALDCGRDAVAAHVRNGDIHKRETTAQKKYLRAHVESLVASQQSKQTA